MIKTQNTDNIKSWENEEQPEFSFIADRNATWYSHTGRWAGSFLQNEHTHTIQKCNALVFTQRIWKVTSTQKYAEKYLQYLYL